MALAARVKSLDEISEALHAHYTEKGGEYVLDVDNPDTLPSVQGLKSAYEKTTRERDRLKEQVAAFGGKSAEEITELEDEVQRLRDAKGGGEPSKDEVAKIEERIARKYDAKYAPVEKENERLKGHLHRTLVDHELDQAIDASGFDARHKPVLRAYLKERGPKVIEDGEKFRGVFSTDINGIPGDHAIGDYVGEFAKTDEARSYFPASGKGGSGADPNARGGGGRNGAKGSINRNDPMAWGQNAEAISKGEVTVAD